jgi:hypothetical protein
MNNDKCVEELMSIAEVMVDKYGAGEFIYAASLVVASLARLQDRPVVALHQFNELLDKHFRSLERSLAS